MLGSAKRHLLFYGVAIAALGVCGGAWAEDAAASAQPAPGATALQEVIVTAQKRSERLVDVPMAVSVVSAQQLKTRGINNIQDLSQAVAGVDITFGGFAVQPAIRGVTSTNPLLENNVAVYIDGFYQQDQNTINAEFANLQNVQILKGPQGALYGRNATGGAILYTTAQPSKYYTGSLEGSYGAYNTWSLNGFISGPINDKMRFSAAGYALQSDGYYKLLNSEGQDIGHAAPIDSYSFRSKIQMDVTDTFQVNVGYNYTELSDARGDQFTPESNILFQPAPGGVPPQQGLLYTPRTGTFGPDGIYPGTQQLDTQNDAQLTLVWHTPIGTLTSYTGQSWRKSQDNFAYGASANILQTTNDRNFQENVDYVITAIKNLDLTIGGNYYRDVLHYNPSNTYVPALIPYFPPDGLYQSLNQEIFTASYALFFQAAYHVTDRLVLSAGLRYSEEEKSEFYQLTTLGTPGVALQAANNRANFPNLSPQGSIRYNFTPNSAIYASITDGFRTGQVQIFADPNVASGFLFAPVKPEEITAYEIGYKLNTRNVQFTTAGFYYNYTNLQQSTTLPNPANPAAPISYVSNAPKAEIYGLEAEVRWQPVPRLDLDVTGAWLHARFTDFPNAVGDGLCSQHAGCNTPTGFSPYNTNIVSQTQNWSGQPLFRSPDFSATFAVDYTFENIFGGTLMPAANVKVTTSYLIDNGALYGPYGPPGLQNTQRFVQPGYAIANFSLTWYAPGQRYHVGVYVNNLSNTNYRLDWDPASFGNYNTWAWPITYGFKVGAKF